MESDEIVKNHYMKRNYQAMNARMQILKPILLKHKGAFNIWEWMQIRDIIRILKDENIQDYG